MAGLINQLIDVLNQQNEIFENLVELSVNKKNVLIKNNVEALKEITDSESSLVNKNSRLDKKRIQCFKDIASVLNIHDDITLSSLIEIIKNQKEAETLKDIRNKTKNLMETLKKNNDENRQLLQYSIEHVEYSMNVIRTAFTNEPCYYDSSGQEISYGKGLFDAKQ